MHSVGNAFHSAAQGDNRQVVVRVTFNKNVVVNGEYIKSLSIKDDFNSGESLTLGNTCSAELTLNMYMPDTLTPTVIKNSEIFVEVGFLEVTEALSTIDTQLYVDEILGYLYQNSSLENNLNFALNNGEIVATNLNNDIAVTLDGNEVKICSNATNIAQFTFFVPMGVYYVNSVESSDDYRSVQIKAYDGMSLLENLKGSYKNDLKSNLVTANELIGDIADKINVEFEINETLPNSTAKISTPTANDKTYREMLGYFAGFLGGNAYFTRLGKLSVKGYTRTDYVIKRSHQYISGLKKTTDDELTINSVTCISPEETEQKSVSLSLQFGYVRFSDGVTIDGKAGGKFYYFYSYLHEITPETIYTLSRKNSEGSVEVFCYDSKHHFLGSTNDGKECINYSDGIMNNNDTSWNFTVINPAAKYIRIMAINNKYTENSSGEAFIDNTYTLIETNTIGGTAKLGEGYGITFYNPYIKGVELLQPIYDYYKGLTYHPQTVKYRGNPAIDKGDIINVENRNGDILNAIITSQTINIGGGMNCTITSCGKLDSETAISNPSNSVSKASSPSKKVEKFKDLISNINKSLTGVIGGFVKFVYDDYGKPRAICITERDAVVNWNESAGCVECSQEINLWTWNNNGFAHSSNGGKSYDDVAITMDGKIVAQILAAKKGYVGNWTINDKSIYASYKDKGVTHYIVLNSTGAIAFAAGALSYSTFSSANLLLMKSGNIRLRNGVGIHTNNTSGENVGAILLTNSNTDSGDAIYFGAGKYKPDSNNEETGMTTYLRGSTIRMYAHNGGVYLGTSGATAVTSDSNFKDSFNIDERYFDFFSRLQPVLYKYKNNNHHRKHIGFIAQDVENALSESKLSSEEFAGLLIEKDYLITKEESGADEDIIYDELYALRYEEFIALNTAIIQRQQKQIDELTKRIERLEAKNGDN